MTAAQRSYLETLLPRHGGEFDENLTKAEASSGLTSCARRRRD
jgi:hypothetical protein